MKGQTPLFERPNTYFPKLRFYRMKVDLQFFASRVSPKGEELQRQVSNKKLFNFIGEYYRAGASIGDGGLADAVKHQITTGELVGGRDHLTKGRERITNLERILKTESLSDSEKAIATKMLCALINAFGGKI